MKYTVLVLALLVVAFGCQKKSEDAGHDHTDADHSHADSAHAGHSHAGGDAASAGTIAPGTWRWIVTVTPVERIAPANPENYTIELVNDSTLAARLDCNRGSGRIVVDGKSIRIGPLAATRMMCPPGSMDAMFGKQLDAARGWFMSADTLMLDLFADSGTMRFVR